MEGKTPAPWFLEVDGQKQGPYTSQEIVKLVMDGALKLESKIFDSAANVWKLAADVIPYLDLGSPTEKSWQPPPKPSELRDVHVVGLNEEPTGGVDYFALISDRKRELERTKAVARAQVNKDAAAAHDEARRRTAPSTTGNRMLLTNTRRADPAKAVRINPSVEASPPPPPGTSPAASTTDGMLSKKSDSALTPDNVISIFSRANDAFRKHKSAISVAAALALVFVGTFGLVRTLSDRKGREPANTLDSARSKPQTSTQTSSQVSSMFPNTFLPKKTAGETKTDESQADGLGSGRNRITRSSGGVAPSNPGISYSRVVPGMPVNIAPQTAPAGAGDSGQAPRDPPQYYSSANDSANPQTAVANSQPATQPEYNYNNNNNYNGNDPNNGVVQPPVFMPAQPPILPQQTDPNGNPAGNSNPDPNSPTPYTN